MPKAKSKRKSNRGGKLFASRYKRGSHVLTKGIGSMGIRGRMRSYMQSMAWHGSPFPRELVTQITYAENLQITSTIGAPSNYLFSSNSLYDPNVSGTGGGQSLPPRIAHNSVGAYISLLDIYATEVL